MELLKTAGGVHVLTVLVVAAGSLYFLPTIVPRYRRKRNAGGIVALNLLFG